MEGGTSNLSPCGIIRQASTYRHFLPSSSYRTTRTPIALSARSSWPADIAATSATAASPSAIPIDKPTTLPNNPVNRPSATWVKVGIIYQLNGREVSRETFMRQKRGFQGGFAMTAPAGNWPLKCWAAGVNPDQRKEAEDYCCKSGVETHYDAEGDAIIRSPKHYRDFCRIMGVTMRNAGYSDPVPQNR